MYEIKFTPEQLQLTVNALEQLPHFKVDNLIKSIMAQAIEIEKKAKEAQSTSESPKLKKVE